MVIEHFDKDLEDDISVKALKNRIYDDIEIWNIIYFTVFLFACFEDNGLPICELERSNYLIFKRKLKYFYKELFTDTPI